MSGLLIPSFGQGFARSAAEAEYPNLWQGLVGSWAPYLGPTGTTLFDYGGRGHKGTLTNMAPGTDWVMTEKGWALEFASGSSQYVDLGTRAWGIGIGDYTFSCWLSTSAQDTQVLLSFADNSPAFYAEYVTNNNPGIFSEEDAVYGGVGFEFNDIAWTNNEWSHLVYVRRAGVVSCYLDGTLSAETVADDQTSIDTVAACIGRRINDNDRYYNGQLNSLALYSRALPVPELEIHRFDSHALHRLRRRVYPAVAAAGGLSIPVAMHHYTKNIAAA